MSVRIALAGNPNCGKTTLFNALTGSDQSVGNWPGVTVEKKEGRLKGHKDVLIIDLPGIYSLSPYTLEEVVARDHLITERPDVLINIVDGTNIERNLYLSTQLMELGIPVVMAVNMMDVVEKSGDKIHFGLLAEKLGCEVVAISALKGTGIQEMAERASAMAERAKRAVPTEKKEMVHAPDCRFSDEVESAIAAVADQLKDVPAGQERFYAIKILEKDDKICGQLRHVPDASAQIAALEHAYDDDIESIITSERYGYISSVISACITKNERRTMTVSDRIDRIVTDRWLALPIFALIMFLVYHISVTTVGTIVTDWTNDVLFGEIIPPAVEKALTAVHCAGWLQGLILDGIVAGVGAVLGFVPQMLVLFLFLAFLESCGYMARVAFIMDRIFRRFGLSGKSFIPMLIGTGCGVPGIMASRTIEADRDRRMTIITTTFIPCSAKLPIIALIAGVLSGGASWVAPSAYLVGIAAVVCSGIILKKTRLFAGEPAPFVMELPAYRMPTAGAVLGSMWERGWSFIKKAGTIILVSTVIVWGLMRFGWMDGSFGMLEPEQLGYSILAHVGRMLSWIFIPLGWGEGETGWKMTVAAVTGLIAKENVVGTLGILFGFAEVTEDGTEIWGQLAGSMSAVAAYSFMVFNLLCAPCFAAMGAIRREMGDIKWTLAAIGYQCGLAYLVSLCVYQIGRLIATGQSSFWTAAAFAISIGAVYLLVRPYGQRTPFDVKMIRMIHLGKGG